MSGKGRFVWYELLTDDPEAAKAFYGAVMGWGTRPWEGDTTPYSIWTAGDTPLGGVMKLLPEGEQEGEAPHWWAHVAVDDVDATARRAQQLGGRIRTPGTDIPGVGRFAVIADPQGAVIAVFKPTGEPMPAPEPMKTGAISWHELHTTDHESAWKFYAELFGWKRTTSLDLGEMGSYVVFRHPADPEDVSMGGMFDAAKDGNLPPHWLYYVNVKEMDGALRRITSEGGKVLHGPMDVPGGGKAAQCMDPQGALFAVFSLN
ncbi:MAG: VOC family protein [Acidobacteriota bacterium]